jgi:hypothetical protein
MAALAAMRPAAVAAGASLVPPPRSAIDACRQRAAQLDAKTRERFGDAAPPEVAALEQNLRVTLEQLQRSVEEGTGVAAALVATDERRRSTISRIGGALDVLARDASLVRQRLDDARSRGDAVAAAALESEADDLAFQMQALRGRLGAVEADLREELAAQEPRADDVATRVAQAEDTFTAAADALARAVG